jgi:hypothetical protein
MRSPESQPKEKVIEVKCKDCQATIYEAQKSDRVTRAVADERAADHANFFGHNVSIKEYTKVI